MQLELCLQLVRQRLLLEPAQPEVGVLVALDEQLERAHLPDGGGGEDTSTRHVWTGDAIVRGGLYSVVRLG